MTLFNYIFYFSLGGKKIKQANYKTAQINNITIHLNQKIMKNSILNYLPTNYNLLSFTDKKIVVRLIKIEIQKSKDNLKTLN